MEPPRASPLWQPSPWRLEESLVGLVGGFTAPGAQAGEEEESLGVAGGTIETPRDALTQLASRRYP